jgi:hypothetical protein
LWWRNSIQQRERLFRSFIQKRKIWSNESLGLGSKSKSTRKSIFPEENILPLQESGQLNLIDLPQNGSILENSSLGFDILID